MKELSFGALMISLGVICIIMSWRRRAHNSRVTMISGVLLLTMGALVTCAEIFDHLGGVFYGGFFLILAMECLVLELTRQKSLKRCAQPCQAVFCGVINYDVIGSPRNKSLRKAAAKFRFFHVDSPVFRYCVEGQTLERAALDYRIRTCLQPSSFLKEYREGGGYTIYLDPNQPLDFVTSAKGARFGLLGMIALACGILAAVVLLVV